MLKKVVLFSALVLTFPAISKAQEITAQLEQLFNKYNKQGTFSGNVLITSGDTVLYKGSFGMAEYAANRNLDETSVFELASVSKQFTAMGIVLLKEKGLLSYEDTLRKFFPELPYEQVTIKHLLQHTSGLPDYMDMVVEHTMDGAIAVNSDIIVLLAKLSPPASFKPGEKWEYSNTGYALLASIIEKVTGIPYGSFLRRNIFEPLGMKNTQVFRRRYEGRKVDNYAFGYVYDSVTKKFQLPDDLNGLKSLVIKLDGIVGDGTVNSTVGDLLKWSEALDRNKLVTAKVKNEIFTPGVLNNGKKHSYGFGWMIRQKAPAGLVVAHSGGWPGYATYIEKHPERKKTIIILNNHGVLGVPVNEVFNILYGIKEVPKKELQLEETALKQYTGEYQLAPGFSINIFVENGRIFEQATGQARAEIFPEKEDLFFLKVVKAQIKFIRNEKKEITGLILLQDGVEMEGNKVK